MEVIPLDGVPDALYADALNPCSHAIRDYLQAATQEFYAFAEEPTGSIDLILGFIPGSLMGNSATVWAMLLKEREVTISKLRECKKLVNELLNDSIEYRAECLVDDPAANKFAKFFGFEFVERLSTRNIYERPY